MDELLKALSGNEWVLPTIFTGIKLAVAGVLMLLLKKPYDIWAEMVKRVSKVEAKEDTNTYIREQTKEQIKEIKETQKNDGYLLRNFIDEFKDHRRDLIKHLNIIPEQKTKILIFDDEHSSSDKLKEDLSKYNGDFTYIVKNNILEAKEAIRWNSDIKYIFSDLYHRKEPIGINFHSQCRLFASNIKFIMYSHATKPGNYNGIFLNKSEITPEKLKIILD
jgi:hypothetical protein